MIEARHLSVKIGEKTILDDVSCSLLPGQITAVMGQNGAGKSTLLRLLAGSLPLQAGSVFIGQKPLQKWTPKALADVRAVLPQATQLAYDLTVQEIIEVGCYNRYHQLTQREREHYLRQELERLDLFNARHRSFLTLSGGEKKRVLLAKCLLQLSVGRKDNNWSQFLLLDEPTAALDIEQQYRFVELVRSLAKERGLGILTIVHDLNLAAAFADKILFLKQGQLISSGASWDLFTPSIIQRVFNVQCIVQRHPQRNIPLITTYANDQRTTQSTRCHQSNGTPTTPTPVSRTTRY
ncbi:MAG: heme ABC transporter ATP-binding protein [Bacteroidota bacterium]